MSKRKFFAPLMGAVVLGLSAYAGYRTYDAYHGVSESDLLLENAEALANGGEGVTNTGPGEIYKCPGLFAGKGKYCKSENNNPCTEDPC